MEQFDLFNQPPPPEGGTPSNTPIEPWRPGPSLPIVLTVAQFDQLSKWCSPDLLAAYGNKEPTVRGILTTGGQHVICSGAMFGPRGDALFIQRVAPINPGEVTPKPVPGMYGREGYRFSFRSQQWVCYGQSEQIARPLD